VLVNLPEDLASSAMPLTLGNGTRELLVPDDTMTQLAFAGGELQGIARELITWRLTDGSIASTTDISLAILQGQAGRRLPLDNKQATEIAFALLFGTNGVMRPGAISKESLRMPPAQIVFSTDRTLAAILGCAFTASGRHCDGELRLVDVAARVLRGSMMKSGDVFDAMLAGTFLNNDKWLVTGGCGEQFKTQGRPYWSFRLLRAGA